jgi:hypothetical protein
MSKGFENSDNIKVTIYKDEVKKLLKDYKKIKKYMKSPIFKIKVMDGDEKIVSKLLDELKDDS